MTRVVRRGRQREFSGNVGGRFFRGDDQNFTYAGRAAGVNFIGRFSRLTPPFLVPSPPPRLHGRRQGGTSALERYVAWNVFGVFRWNRLWVSVEHYGEAGARVRLDADLGVLQVGLLVIPRRLLLGAASGYLPGDVATAGRLLQRRPAAPLQWQCRAAQLPLHRQSASPRRVRATTSSGQRRHSARHRPRADPPPQKRSSRFRPAPGSVTAGCRRAASSAGPGAGPRRRALAPRSAAASSGTTSPHRHRARRSRLVATPALALASAFMRTISDRWQPPAAGYYRPSSRSCPSRGAPSRRSRRLPRARPRSHLGCVASSGRGSAPLRPGHSPTAARRRPSPRPLRRHASVAGPSPWPRACCDDLDDLLDARRPRSGRAAPPPACVATCALGVFSKGRGRVRSCSPCDAVLGTFDGAPREAPPRGCPPRPSVVACLALRAASSPSRCSPASARGSPPRPPASSRPSGARRRSSPVAPRVLFPREQFDPASPAQWGAVRNRLDPRARRAGGERRGADPRGAVAGCRRSGSRCRWRRWST